MKRQFHSDNGANCWRCDGTIYTYTVDEYVSYVGATCISCRADNIFHPPKGAPLDTAANVSAAHRKESPVVTLHTTTTADDYERRLQETSRMSGVPVDRLRQMVESFNNAVFTPPPTK